MKWFVILFATSCGFSEPLGPPDSHVDPPPDVDPPDPNLALVEGTISSGGGALEVGTLTVLDDGFEAFERVCNNTLCVTGGVIP